MVDFAQIEKVYPGQAENLSGSGSNVPIGPTSHSERSTLFDPLWGYIEKFGQVFGFQFDEARTYGTLAHFTIKGTFTRDCVAGGTGNGASLSDSAAFNALVAIYGVLNAVFDTAAQSAAPADVTQWGTSADPRCIALPAPLVDSSGNTIYALAESITIQPGLWANGITYEANLIEAKFPQQKVVVNGVTLDSGVINVKLPAPILRRKRLAGCTGEVIQVINYTCMELSITGTIPRQQSSGNQMASQTRALSDSLSNMYASVQLYDKSNGLLNLFTNYNPDAGGGISVTAEDLEDHVTINLKAQQ